MDNFQQKVAFITSQEVREQFFIRLNSGTRAIDSDGEVPRYIAQRWGTA